METNHLEFNEVYGHNLTDLEREGESDGKRKGDGERGERERERERRREREKERGGYLEFHTTNLDK